MEEIWKNIKGYEDRYQVSNLGNVRSLMRNGTKGGEVKKNERHGYLRVRLWKNKSIKTIGIHRLVAQAFITNPLNKPQVNHKNGNKKDNRVENLEWVNATENMNHAYNNGLCKTKKVTQIKNGIVLNTYLNIYRASIETGIQYASIYRCANGVGKTAGGYEWRYID